MSFDIVRCIRCEWDVPLKSMGDRCTCAPDNGPHEGEAPTTIRPPGYSTHEFDCPRAAPFMVGNEIVDSACTCRRVTA